MRIVACIVASSVLLAACGPNCQSTCKHVFDPSECGIHPPGVETAEQIRDCAHACENALNKAGNLDSYDPDTPDYSGEVELENEKQAAAWMDCVWETTPDATAEQCENLEIGYCAPINF